MEIIFLKKVLLKWGFIIVLIGEGDYDFDLVGELDLVSEGFFWKVIKMESFKG